MKPLYKLTLTLFFCILLNFNLIANDTIHISWHKWYSYSTIYVRFTEGKQIRVDWGDGSTPTQHIGLGSENYVLLDHSYNPGSADKLHVTIFGVTGDCKITAFKAENQEIDSIDLSNVSQLKILNCHHNLLNLLDLNQNKELEILDISYNRLKNIDLRQNVALKEIECGLNGIEELDLEDNINLQRFICNNGGLQYLAFASNVNLDYVQCENNYISTLKFRPNTHIKTLDCMSNRLKELDLSATSGLKRLICTQNSLTKLDLGQNESLSYISCYSNRLTALNLSQAVKLDTLICAYNELAELDCSKNPQLKYLHCYDNFLKVIDVKNCVQLRRLDCNDNYLTELDLSSCMLLENLGCSNCRIKDLRLGTTDALQLFGCKNNQLKNLDLRSCSNLTFLDCSNNRLTNLGLGQNPKLEKVICFTNYLVYLNLGGLSALKWLECYNNLLLSLDVSKNLKLANIECYNNAISFPDLYTASQRIININYKSLGTQILPSVTVALNESIDLSDKMEIGGKKTVVVVKKDDGEAIENTDYTFIDNKLCLKTDGIYKIEMTNIAIGSSFNFPAKVILVYIAGLVTERQQITFTCKGSAIPKKVITQASPLRRYTIDWGDGHVDTCAGWNTKVTLEHEYTTEDEFVVKITSNDKDCFFYFLDIYQNFVLSLDVTSAIKLENLTSSANQLSYLDLRKNNLLQYVFLYDNYLTLIDLPEVEGNGLYYLSCENNRLSGLDLSKNKQIRTIYCNNNAISMTDLYNLPCYNQTSNFLGTQNLPLIIVPLGEPVDISENMTFGGIPTQFSIKKEGLPALENSDYTFSGGRLTFLKSAFFSVEMTNDAIISNPIYPAKVIAHYAAGTAGMPKGVNAKLKVYPNPTSGELNIENEDFKKMDLIKLFNLEGKVVFSTTQHPFNISHLPAGIYLINANGKYAKIIKQ